MGVFIIFQSVLLWWYYNDKKAYRILAILPFAAMGGAMLPGVHTVSDELILQISCNIFMAFKWTLMMTSGQNISHYTTAKLSVHVWNRDLIWWQNKIDTQKHFHMTTITSSWTLRKTKIPITIVKAQTPSNPNQKFRTRDNKFLHPLRREGWNHLCIPKLQLRNRWSSVVHKSFHSTLNWARDYLSMLGLMLIHVSKKIPCRQNDE